MVVFEKCDSETGIKCKSESDIAEWMVDKYLIILTNQKKFISHKFEEDRLKARAELNWIRLNSASRHETI